MNDGRSAMRLNHPELRPSGSPAEAGRASRPRAHASVIWIMLSAPADGRFHAPKRRPCVAHDRFHGGSCPASARSRAAGSRVPRPKGRRACSSPAPRGAAPPTSRDPAAGGTPVCRPVIEVRADDSGFLERNTVVAQQIGHSPRWIDGVVGTIRNACLGDDRLDAVLQSLLQNNDPRHARIRGAGGDVQLHASVAASSAKSATTRSGWCGVSPNGRLRRSMNAVRMP